MKKNKRNKTNGETKRQNEQYEHLCLLLVLGSDNGIVMLGVLSKLQKIKTDYSQESSQMPAHAQTQIIYPKIYWVPPVIAHESVQALSNISIKTSKKGELTL
jgi:hypothetical protein